MARDDTTKTTVRQDGASPSGRGAGQVTILMGLWNGAPHLQQQLDSLAAQTHENWRLVVSDDGSTDAGPAILDRFAAGRPAGQVLRVAGPRDGVARNYLSMIRALPQEPGWLAFADQDDIWLPDRLARGLAALAALPDPAAPALHCGRTLVFGDDPAITRISAPRPRPPGFRNALVQNIAAGNTILLNPAAARLLRAVAQVTRDVVVHDWWAYQIVSGAEGGRILHDDRPCLLYRQHRGNLIGANDSLVSNALRLRMLLDGTVRRWTDINLAALQGAGPWLSAEARAAVAGLARARRGRTPLRRLALFRRLGLYRQTRAGTLALWLAMALRRL